MRVNLLHNEANRTCTVQKGVHRVVPSEAASEVSALLANTSARTLILGIDKAGRVLQHDRNAAEVLGDAPGALLGVELGSLLTVPAHVVALTELISAATADREGTAVLTARPANAAHPTPAVLLQSVGTAVP